MSRDPGVCGTCHEAKVRAKHKQPRIDLDNITASSSGSLGGKVKAIKNAAHPYKYDDESHCANINCANGQKDISDETKNINKGLRHAAQTGDWTKINKKDLERLEQLSDHATEVVDVADIEWLDNEKTEEWQDIQDEIDDFEQKTGEAIERTAEVDGVHDTKVHGKERINECRSTLDNLDGVRHSIYVQDVVVDNVHQVVERETEHEVVVDEGTAISENNEDAQQERDETDQTPDQESTEVLKERIAELETENEDLNGELADRDETIEDLKEKNEDLETEKEDLEQEKEELETEKSELLDEKRELIDEKREVVDENHGLTKDIMELQQEIQQLQATTHQQAPERENDAAANAPSERAGAGNGAASPEATGGGEAEAAASGSSSRDPATETPPEGDQAGASANGDTKSLSKGQRWVRNPDADKPAPNPEQYEQLFGESLSEEARNGGTENTGPAREDERDGRDEGTDQERDDDAPAGGPNF
jgi:peptidoglycan hydrolase CwlO-like protein